MPKPKNTGRRLILFGRYPVPGRTKTRLIDTLGALGTAELQRVLTEKTLDTLCGIDSVQVIFCYADGRPDQARRWLKVYPIQMIPQTGDDLGNRMAMAIQTAFTQGAYEVVLVGTDIPELKKDHVEAAFEALSTYDLVLGPSSDGGYWLVGCRHPVDIFTNIAWGTAAVLEQTLAAARRSGLSTGMLEALNDIDTVEDLHRWRPQQQWRRPYLSVIIPTINEERWIEDAVTHVRSPDTEILVADGGSRDRTRQLARQAGAIVLSTDRGRADQQNHAASKARGRVLLFLHADTRLPVDFSTHIFELLMDPDLAAGAFRFKTDLAHWAMRIVERCAHIRSTLFHLPYGDQALFMRKRTFDEIGGFPRVPVAEDLLLVRDLAKKGTIGIAPAAAVTSGRRWQNKGIWRTTAINYIIAGGLLIGLAPHRLAPLYQREKSIREDL